VLIDVREPDEHSRERIAGATLMPLSRFDPRRAAALCTPGQRLVLHCRGGRRSEDAAKLAAGAARSQVVTMSGGIEAWRRDGLAVSVDRSVSRISVMRQVQLVIGTGVLGGAALAWLVHPWFLVIPAFFGAGLVFAGATGTCGLASLLGVMPWNKSAACSAAGQGDSQ
jgi:rhodanese-related sulfurtransferase